MYQLYTATTVIGLDKPGVGNSRDYLPEVIQSNYTHLLKDVTNHVATSPIQIS